MNHPVARWRRSRWATNAALRVLVVMGAVAFGLWARWPWLPDDAVGAVLETAVGVAFVVTGLLFRAERAQRGNGALFLASGFLALANALDSRGYGPWPFLSWAVRPFDELLLMVILLRYPAARISDPVIRRVVVAAFVAVTVPLLGSALVWEPVAAGSPAAIWWPTVTVNLAASGMLWYGFAGAGLLAAIATVAFAVRRYLRSSGLGRRELIPVLVAAIAVGVSYVVLQAAQLIAQSNNPNHAIGTTATLALLAVPAAFIATALRRRLDRAAVADLLVGIPQPATVASVRDALRHVLVDPALDVYVWLPDRQVYTDGDATVPTPEPNGRLRRDLRDAGGERLATILADASLHRRADVVDAAVRAAALSLENARLHAELLVRLQELQQSRARIVEAGVSERRRVERDLHDGAQQRLLALAATIGRARTAAADPAMSALLEQARSELRTALRELRDLARGIHPAVLEQVGLAAAVETVAESLPLPVQVDIDTGRLPPAVESTAYFVICEGLVNVVKHADATRAVVTVTHRDGRLHLTVQDDGVGGTRASTGGGIAGLTDRVTALGGRLDLHSPSGAGTRLTVELPCE